MGVKFTLAGRYHRPTLVFGYINGKRLNTSRNKQSLILAIGLLGLFAVIALAVEFSTAQNSLSDNYRTLLGMNRLIAVIVYYVIYRLQLSDFRVYCIRFRDDKDILEKTDSATGMVIGLALLQELALYGMMTALTRVG
ncbi:MAG: hypothetical protein ABFD64_06270 [Armatimonadota bacterium]